MTTAHKLSPRAWFCLLRCPVLLLVSVLLGCHSAPPPPPAPQLIAVAQHHARAATQAEARQQWALASSHWTQAAQSFALLNRLPEQANALHHLGLSLRRLDRSNEARAHLEHAARLNQSLHLDDPWWRNQIALLQLEVAGNDTNAVAARLESLSPRASQIPTPLTQAAFANERGQWHLLQNNLSAAETDLRQALQKYRQARDPQGLATATANLARVLEQQGQFKQAQALWAEALSRFEILGDAHGIASSLAGLGRALLAQNQDLSQAEDLLHRAALNFEYLRETNALHRTLQALAECRRVQGKAPPAEGSPQ